MPTGWFWYLGTLVPVIGLLQVGAQSMADRYTYIPLIGLSIAIAWGVPDLLLRRPRTGNPINGRKITLLALAAGLLVMILSAITFNQVGYWRDSVTLFEHTLAVTKNNYLIHTNLGLALAKQGKDSEAIAHYYEALRLKPDGTEILNNLAWILATTGDRKYRDGAEAVRLATRACELTGYSETTILDTLAAAYAETGRYEEAVQTEQKALDLVLSSKKGESVLLLRERIQLYKSQRPYGEHLPSGSDSRNQ